MNNQTTKQVKRVFERMHKTYREQLAKRLHLCTDIMHDLKLPEEFSLDDPDYLQTAYGLIGRVEFRLRVIEECQQMLREGTGSYFGCRIETLDELEKLTKRQKETALKLVKAYVYRKDNQDKPAKTAQA